LFKEELRKAQFFKIVKVIRAQACEDAKEAQAAQVKLDKEKQKERKLVAKAVKEALAKQEKIRIAKQKEINCQVKAKAKKQGILDKVIARKEAIAIKKAAISAKPFKIVILHIRSSIL